MILQERLTALIAIITQTLSLKPESLDEKEGNLIYIIYMITHQYTPVRFLEPQLKVVQ